MQNPIRIVSVTQLPDSWAWPFRWRWHYSVDGVNYRLRRRRFNKGWVLRFRKGGERVTIESPWASLEPMYIAVNGYKWELAGTYGASWGPMGHMPTWPPRTHLPPQVVSVVNAALEDTVEALAPLVQAQKNRRDRKYEARELARLARQCQEDARRTRKFVATMNRLT